MIRREKANPLFGSKSSPSAPGLTVSRFFDDILMSESWPGPSLRRRFPRPFSSRFLKSARENNSALESRVINHRKRLLLHFLDTFVLIILERFGCCQNIYVVFYSRTSTRKSSSIALTSYENLFFHEAPSKCRTVNVTTVSRMSFCAMYFGISDFSLI